MFMCIILLQFEESPFLKNVGGTLEKINFQLSIIMSTLKLIDLYTIHKSTLITTF